MSEVDSAGYEQARGRRRSRELPDLVVLDTVGTTVQATGTVPAAYREAFASVGIRLSASDIDSVRGQSKEEAITRLLREHGRDPDEGDASAQVFRCFRAIVARNYRNTAVTPIDGALETITWCRSAGIRTALTTGFDRQTAELIVDKLGWRDSIDALVCADDVERGRPAPDLILRAMQLTGCIDPERVACVGDTVADLEAASSAGVRWNVGVLSGAHSMQQLAGVRAAVIVASVRELPAVFAPAG